MPPQAWGPREDSHYGDLHYDDQNVDCLSQYSRDDEECPHLRMRRNLPCEDVSRVLHGLDGIRRLASNAQGLRRQEGQEESHRSLYIAQVYSLLLEDADFNAGAIRQRSVFNALTGIQSENANVLFFSPEEARSKLARGPSIPLRDVLHRPARYEARLLVDAEVLKRMLAELHTQEIVAMLEAIREHVAIKQTTYQCQPVEERDSYTVQNGAALAVLGKWLYVADPAAHVIWRVALQSFNTQGNHKVELFAGSVGSSGLHDGPLLAARFRSPMGIVACETKQSLYIADTDNDSIRQIDIRLQEVFTLALSEVPQPFAAGASLVSPKGICIIHGGEEELKQMDYAQEQRVTGNDGEPDPEKRPSDSDSDIYPGQGDSRQSWSGSSSVGSSYEVESGSEPESEERTSPRGRKEGAGSPQKKGPPEEEETGLGLEQTLTLQMLNRYSVMQSGPLVDTKSGPPKLLAPQPSRAALPQMQNFIMRPASRPHSRPHSARRREHSRPESLPASSVGSETKTRPSMTEASFGMQEPGVVDQEQIRLAVTCDHCVWYVNPDAGRMHIVAGSPTAYGYVDAGRGHRARFSSPKGIINVRSVLFVADYWNNAIRCINLLTTQVDTVLDLNSQGPVAFALSPSGVLHVLDSEGIHGANILQITSEPRRGPPGIGQEGTGSQPEGYQTLFNPRKEGSRQSSITSFATATSALADEVWDPFRPVKQVPPSRASLLQYGQMRSSVGYVDSQYNEVMPESLVLPSNFRSKLENHLVADVPQKEDGREKQKKSKKEDKKKKRRRRPRPDVDEDGVDRTYIDPRLLGEPLPEAEGSSSESDGALNLPNWRPEARGLDETEVDEAELRDRLENLRQNDASDSDVLKSKLEHLSRNLTETPETRAPTATGDRPGTSSDVVTRPVTVMTDRPETSMTRPDTSMTTSRPDTSMTRPVTTMTHRADSTLPEADEMAVTTPEPSDLPTEDQVVGKTSTGSKVGEEGDAGDYIEQAKRKASLITPQPKRLHGSFSAGGARSPRPGSFSIPANASTPNQLQPATTLSDLGVAQKKIPSRRNSIAIGQGAAAPPPSRSRRGSWAAQSAVVAISGVVDEGGDEDRPFIAASIVPPRQTAPAGAMGSRKTSLDFGGKDRGSVMIKEGKVLHRQSGGEWGETPAEESTDTAPVVASPAGLAGIGESGENITFVDLTANRKEDAPRRSTLLDIWNEEAEAAGAPPLHPPDMKRASLLASGRVRGSMLVMPTVEDNEHEGHEDGENTEDIRPLPDHGNSARRLSVERASFGSVDAILGLQTPNRGSLKLGSNSQRGSLRNSSNRGSLKRSSFGASEQPFGGPLLLFPEVAGSDYPSASVSRRMTADGDVGFPAGAYAGGHLTARGMSISSLDGFDTQYATNKALSLMTKGGHHSTWQKLDGVKLHMFHHDRRYPNTPLSIAWCERGSPAIFVGLLSFPTLLKVVPPRSHTPSPPGRFEVLPVDSRRCLLADESSHQVWMVNSWSKTKRHIAGCGKRGHLDGPLDICRMSMPCSLALDPHTHLIYVAEKGNHRIRRIDLCSGLMSTVCGNGQRGNSDGTDLRKQTLDSPYQISFAEPHYLLISCADNSVRKLNLNTGMLRTILIGS
eukprot:gnl/MRDRNA2_/MRDRNA2_103501_c0_seq1.p1 gnl/MRDRNA2_/MRDRNA2_103501_c0~~gnl/MRDRNA2_/MRDRNA2_103501_c0_seq1.p1  ORF type:complete len:1613 (+),score=314.97 gnl/MRDRNA2_/MRDRNA2_103501_c0_seq1:62-4900(+)